MLNPAIFREYDIRGIADTELLSPDIEQLGRGLGTYLRRRSGGANINVGRDCRLSSTRLRDALVKGLLAAGCNVTDIGTVPTPVLYHSAQNLNANGAIMITGSHNPSDYNGFKSVCGPGSLHGEAIQKVRDSSTAPISKPARETSPPPTPSRPTSNEIAAQFHLDRRIKVVADAGNGTAGPVIHRIFEKLNVDATELFFEMDGHFPNHHPDPTVPANLAHLIAKVRETGADLGIAFDGDSDRIGAVDEHGNVIYGDLLLLIYAREILQRKPGATFIGEVKCSQVMYDQIAKLGGNGIMYKTGHSLIKAKMKQEHAELAGEMSGHMFFADRYRGYRRRSLCRLPPDRNRFEVRPAAFGATRGRAENGFHSGDPRRLPRRHQVRPCAARRAAFQEPVQDDRYRWRARDLPGRLGPAARIQHAARPRDALRSHQRTSC